MTHKEEIARLRKLLRETIKNIELEIEICEEEVFFDPSQRILKYLPTLKSILNDIEEVAIIEGRYTLDKLMRYIENANENLYNIKSCINKVNRYLNHNAWSWKDTETQIEIIKGNVKEFISVFNKLTQLQKDS